MFHDVQFPLAIAENAHGGPTFNTTVNATAAGFEQRNINWSVARAAYDISYGIKTRRDAQAVVDFFYARWGRAHSFRFKDYSDWECGASQEPHLIGTGDGVNTLFQAVKIYSSGGFKYVRTLTRLIVDTARVYVGSALQPPGSAYTLGPLGLITFAVPPPVGVYVGLWTQFDVPVRFDVDYLDTNIVRPEIMEVPSITLIEVRETPDGA